MKTTASKSENREISLYQICLRSTKVLKMADWRKHLLGLLVMTGFLSNTPQVSAAVTYTEDFSVNTNSTVGVVGWNVYLKNNDGVIDDLTNHNLNSQYYNPAGIAYTSEGQHYAFVAPRTHNEYNTAQGPSLLFTTEASNTLTTTAISNLLSLSVKINADGSSSDNALGRFAIRIGDQWLASNTYLKSNTNDGPSGDWTEFNLEGIDFTSGIRWRYLEASPGSGGALFVGAIMGGTISGDINAFGFYQESGNGGDHFRIDDFSVTVVPEPSSIGITSIALAGIFFYRRHKKSTK